MGLPVEAALDVPSEEAELAEFDRASAQGLIGRAFDRWKQELVQRAEDHWKLALVRLIHAEGVGKLPSVAELATRLRVPESRVRHFVYRDSKKRLKEEIPLEIREANPGEAEAREELDYLLRCVAQVQAHCASPFTSRASCARSTGFVRRGAVRGGGAGGA